MCFQKKEKEEGKGFLPKDTCNISIYEQAKALAADLPRCYRRRRPVLLGFPSCRGAEWQRLSGKWSSGEIPSRLREQLTADCRTRKQTVIFGLSEKRWRWFGFLPALLALRIIRPLPINSSESHRSNVTATGAPHVLSLPLTVVSKEFYHAWVSYY